MLTLRIETETVDPLVKQIYNQQKLHNELHDDMLWMLKQLLKLNDKILKFSGN